MYGRLYAPSPRLDALYVHRLAPTLQALVSLITVPSPAPAPTLSWESPDALASLSASASTTTAAASAPATTATSGPLARLSELELKLQQDTGRWTAEYSYAVGDGMWGVRGLYNFGRWGAPGGCAPSVADDHHQGAAAARETGAVDGGRDAHAAVDGEDEDETLNGLKGRWSAGGEIYFSAQERSAGVSTGVRFATIPESAGGPPQPPTYITATLNPIMGQLSTAYAVQVGRDASLASRFDFNLYSYDAEVTVGGEWFYRRVPPKKEERDEPAPALATFDAFGRGADDDETRLRKRNLDAEDEVLGVLKLRASTSSVRRLHCPAPFAYAEPPTDPLGPTDARLPVGRPSWRLSRLGRTGGRPPAGDAQPRARQPDQQRRRVALVLGMSVRGAARAGGYPEASVDTLAGSRLGAAPATTERGAPPSRA